MVDILIMYLLYYDNTYMCRVATLVSVSTDSHNAVIALQLHVALSQIKNIREHTQFLFVATPCVLVSVSTCLIEYSKQVTVLKHQLHLIETILCIFYCCQLWI